MKNRPDRKRTLIITGAVVTLLCCLMAIGGLNRPHVNPFANKLLARYPTVLGYSDLGCTVIDSQGKRLLITDSNDQLTGIIDTTKSGSSVDRINFLSMIDDRIFAVGYSCYDKGTYLSSESVIEYDMRGRMVGTLYTVNYAESDKMNAPCFSNISGSNAGLMMAVVNGTEVTLLRIDENGTKETGHWTMPETAYMAGYVAELDTLHVIGITQNCYQIDCKTGVISNMTYAEYLESLLKSFHIDPSCVDIRVLDDCCSVVCTTLNLGGKAWYYSVVNEDDSKAVVLTNDTGTMVELGNIEYSPWFMLKNILFWLAVAILGAELIALIAWMLIKKLSAKGRIVFVIIGAILLTSIFYTSQITSATEKSYCQSLVTQTKQISYVLTETCGDLFATIREEGVREFSTDVKNQEDIQKLHKVLKALCNANDSNQSCYAICFLWDEDGNLYSFVDSGNNYVCGAPLILSDGVEELLNESKHMPIVRESSMETVMYDYEYIRSSDGEIVGVLSIAGKRGNLRHVQTQRTVNMTVSLIALFIGVYMLYSLVKTFSADLKRRRARNPEDAVGKSLDMAGIFAFCQGIIYGLDSVIVVYVAKSLCANMSPAYQAVIVSLPVALTTVGQLLGSLSATPVVNRFGERTAAILAAVMAICGALLSAFAVGLGSIWPFLLGKMIFGFAIPGMMFVLSQTVPYRAKGDEERKTSLTSVLSGSTAATIVSALIGGYVSQYLSFLAIYLLTAVLCLGFIIVCVLSFEKGKPNTQTPEGNGNQSVGKRGNLLFFFRGPMLVYTICFLVPGVIAGGYKSYLFPMYSSGAGISPLLLSNLSVFVRALTLMTQNRMNQLAKRFNPDTVMVGPMLVICGCLVCFIISPNIYWAIIMMFIYESMTRMARVPDRMYISAMAEKAHLNVKGVQGDAVTLDSLLRVFQSPILSSAVALGMNYACAAVGAVCGALYLVFAFFNRHLKKQG